MRAGLMLAAFAVFNAMAADPPPPEWARQLAAQAVPAFPARTTRVVLLREENVTVEAGGRHIMRERGAIRSLRNGAENMRAFRSYNAKTGKIRDFQAWMIPPSGKPSYYGKSQIVDVALSQNEAYSENRGQGIDGGRALPDSVFAFEVTEEEKSIFTQYQFWLQEDAPVLLSRLNLTLPPGWEVTGKVLGRENSLPRVSGNNYAWEFRDLPAIEREDYAPAFLEMAPRLALSWFPPAGNTPGLVGLKDWTAVSIWMAQFMDPPAEVTEPVRARAAELTRGATEPEAKIRAIGEFVQKTSYVEVAMNLTRGGGYTPHKAAETLARNSGDCKDKATLMRAMLKSVGIDSWMAAIRSGDRDFVKTDWASPHQFNHAIIAVRVPDSVQLPTVIRHPALGRLLMFDPTDSVTKLGGLPINEQGSQALILAGDQGSLMTMPRLPPDANRIESTTLATMDGNGALQGTIQRQYFGQSSIFLRAVEKMRGKEELQKIFERRLNRVVGSTAVADLATQSNGNDDQIAVTMNLTARQFGQSMQGKLLIVRPGLLTSGGEYFFSNDRRTTPVRLNGDLRRDTIRIRIPQGFKLDEKPSASKIEGAYGTLEATWDVKDGEIIMTQTLEVKPVTVPAAEYEAVRKFFNQLGGAQAAPVVLAKQ